MKRRMAAILAMALFSCGSADSAFRETVARNYDKACRQPAPTPKLARELDQLCSCTLARIRSSDIKFGDGQAVVTAKIQGFMEACARLVYGEETPADSPS